MDERVIMIAPSGKRVPGSGPLDVALATSDEYWEKLGEVWSVACAWPNLDHKPPWL